MIEQYQDNTINVLSLKERQIGYEKLYDKKQSRKLIRERFSLLLTKDYPKDKLNLMCDILGVLALRKKRISVNAIVEILVNRQLIEEYTSLIMESLLELRQLDLVENEWDEKSRLYFVGKFSLSKEDLELLDQYQYKIPMLVKPLPVNQKGNNRGNGYYLNSNDSLILNNSHTFNIESNVLDKLNSTPLCLNLSLMKHIRNSFNFDTKGKSPIEIKEMEENFERYEKGVFNVSSILIKNGNKFYLTHKYDKRGRIYSCGYHINIQGNAYAKAQLEFANKQLITEEIKFF